MAAVSNDGRKGGVVDGQQWQQLRVAVVTVGEMAATIGDGGNDTWWEGQEKVCATPSNTNSYRSQPIHG